MKSSSRPGTCHTAPWRPHRQKCHRCSGSHPPSRSLLISVSFAHGDCVYVCVCVCVRVRVRVRVRVCVCVCVSECQCLCVCVRVRLSVRLSVCPSVSVSMICGANETFHKNRLTFHWAFCDALVRFVLRCCARSAWGHPCVWMLAHNCHWSRIAAVE